MGHSRLDYLIRNAEIGNVNAQEIDERVEVDNNAEAKRTQHLIDVLHLDVPEDNQILPGRVYNLPSLNPIDPEGETIVRFSSTTIKSDQGVQD